MTFSFKFKRSVNDPEQQEKEYNLYHFLTVKNIKTRHKKLHYMYCGGTRLLSNKDINTEGRMNNHLRHLGKQPRIFTSSVRACALVMARSALASMKANTTFIEMGLTESMFSSQARSSGMTGLPFGLDSLRRLTLRMI